MCVIQGLLNKGPSDRLTWPQLLEHPFVQETNVEVVRRQMALADAQQTAAGSRAWKGEDGAVAGALHPEGSPLQCHSAPSVNIWSARLAEY